MPEEEPLQTLAPLKIVFESEDGVLVCEIEQVDEFGRCLHDWKWGRDGIVDDHGDAAYQRLVASLMRQERELPFGFRRRNQSFFCSLVEISLHMLARHSVNAGNGSVHQGRGPLCPVDIGQFLQQNLDFLAIRRTLRNQMESLRRCVIFSMLSQYCKSGLCIP